MSDNILKLIPSSPTYLPSSELAQRVMPVLKNIFPHADKISFKQSDSIRFIDPGSNMERVVCPNCNSIIDATWWRESMDIAYKSHFSDLTITVPCATRNSLNELKYEMPAGFAKFSIEIRNPKNELHIEELREVEIILNTKLRLIWAHY